MLGLVSFLDWIVSYAINIYVFILIVRAIISWVNPDPYNPVVRILYKLTEPILYPIRRVLWRFSGNIPIDFSPLIAILLLYVFRTIFLKVMNALLLLG